MGQESPQKQPPASPSPFCIGPKFKARASPGSGVWSPHNRSTEILTKAELAERSRDRSTNPDPPPQPVWTPRSAPPSPVAERREFRPIGFESPTPQRRNQCPTPTTPAPWTTAPGYEKPVEFSSKPNVSQGTTRPEPTAGTTEQRGRALQNSNSLPTIGHSVRFAPQQQQLSRQQAVPSPTINTLLKNKDGKIGQQVSTFESASSQSNVYQTSTSQRTTSNQQTSYQRSSSGTRLGRTSEISQPVTAGRQVDYLSEPESVEHHQRSTPTMAQLSPRKVDGVGPMTREGMPLTLRSEVDENNQAKWYKKMYQTLHKAHDDDDFVTVRYKTRRGNFPYKSSGGYQSEPEPNYDSDYTIKYSTLDRRRTPTALNPNSYSRFNTLQGSAIKSGSAQYRNQPGRIENYTPGRSSISEKESKEQIEQQKLSNSKTYTEGNLSRALKQEQGGYDSDTTLIFRKKEPPASSALSPIEQKQYYKNMQAGGEIPVQGFRKPAPEKPKKFSNVPPPPPMKGTSLLPNPSSPYSKSSNEPESPRRYIESDVNIHYKTPIRYEYKEAIPDDELAYRQAEHMRRVYQEERRRKYMHELEDLQNRRHTDNFVPSQKSPIPVNRYEDFDADLAPKPNNVLPRTIARALYNFQGQTARELSFKKGDIIYLRRQIDKNWYEGEHNAMIGLLPANYIEILPRDGAKPLPKKPQREGKARAKFNFTAQTSVELSLMKGELVTLTRRVDDNWFEGRIGNKKGIFPVSYVEVLTDIGGEESYEIEPIVKPNLQTIQTHTLTTGYDNGLSNGRISPGIIRETKTVQKTEVLHVDTTNEPISYRALYNYKPQNSDELELLEGDVVYVLEKCDDGWYVGTSARTGCFGTFPGNYVKKL
uniref:Putative sorbin and sh3 domain-containing protein n=1 Tax=Culex tarsalis TaxID=7177 RepID=A0A1Q3FYY4_CULTA